MSLSNKMTLNRAVMIMKEKIKDRYAQAYLQAIDDAVSDHGTEGLTIQLMYILENSSGWRGPEAKEVKNFVKEWIKNKYGKVQD